MGQLYGKMEENVDVDILGASETLVDNQNTAAAGLAFPVAGWALQKD